MGNARVRIKESRTYQDRVRMPLWEGVGVVADRGFGTLALQMDHSSQPFPFPFPYRAWVGAWVGAWHRGLHR